MELHPEDARNGYTMRRVMVEIGAPPPGHGITVNGEFSPLKEIICDVCGEVCPRGQPACAVTMWRPSRETPPDWESDYGKVLS